MQYERSGYIFRDRDYDRSPSGIRGRHATHGESQADREARARRERLHSYEGRPLFPYKSRLGLYLDDSLIILGLVLGGAAGYLAAAKLRFKDEPPEYFRSFVVNDTDRQQRGYGSSRRRAKLEDDETHELISSDKVEGTAVYGRDGEKIGSISNFMVSKRSGKVAYAVVSIGGFLGLGDTRHPLPWDQLTFDEKKGGYVIRAVKDELVHAPSHAAADNALGDPDYHAAVKDYWRSPAYR